MGRYYTGQRDISYYRYLILQGIPIHAELLPAANTIKTRREEKNFYSEDADVCLRCNKQYCSGSAQCYARRRDEIMAEKKLNGKNRKEVME